MWSDLRTVIEQVEYVHYQEQVLIRMGYVVFSSPAHPAVWRHPIPLEDLGKPDRSLRPRPGVRGASELIRFHFIIASIKSSVKSRNKLPSQILSTSVVKLGFLLFYFHIYTYNLCTCNVMAAADLPVVGFPDAGNAVQCHHGTAVESLQHVRHRGEAWL